jgi:uncharacterized cupin superfamily protein
MSQSRPDCVVNIADLPGEKRPRYTNTPGVGAVVRTLGRVTGLTQMGVHLRTVSPGLAGTNRHFHTVEEEWVYVLGGTGRARIGPLDLQVEAGCFAGFPPGPCPHHMVNDTTEDLVFLEGGESREAEDGCWYPDARLMSQGRRLVEPYEEPPPEVGNENQLVRIDALPIRDFPHDVDDGACRQMRVLHRPTGLERQAVYWARVAAGDRSTAFHTHERTDEWVYILSGRAEATVGDEKFEVGPGDFLGHPARSACHVMEAMTELIYLMGGVIDASDVVTYPRHGLKRIGGRLEPAAR